MAKSPPAGEHRPARVPAAPRGRCPRQAAPREWSHGGAQGGATHSFPSSRTHRHSQTHTVHYVRPNGTHGGHAEALRRRLPVFSTLPQQAEVTLLRKTLKQALEEATGAIVGSEGQECKEASWEGALGHVMPTCPQVAPTAGVSPPIPISTKAQPQRARSLSHGPGHSGPVVRRSVTRGKGDQESSDTQDCWVSTLGPACQTNCPLPPPSITCPAAQPCANPQPCPV